MKEEYEKENFGKSAFECQQGIEQTLKAILLRNKTSHNPKKYRHDIILRLWSDMYHESDFSKWPPEHEETIRELLGVLDCIIKKSLDGKKPWKIMWWKHSLYVKLNEDENEKLVSTKKRIVDSLLKAKTLADYILNMPSLKELNQTKIRKKVSPEVRLCLDNIQQILSKSPNTSSLKDIQELSILYFHLLKLAHRQNPRSRGLKVGFYKEDVRPLLTMWLFGFSDLLLKLYSHEDIGRYPRMLDCGTSTRDVYSDNKKALKSLEDEAECAFVELYEEALTIN